MALEDERAQHPEHPASSRNLDSGGSAPGEEPENAVRHETANTAAQPTSPSHGTETGPRPLLSANDDNASEASISSDAVSEEVACPSVSVPPYWSHSGTQDHSRLHPHGTRHTRAVSNASAESVLPPGAITLQDNERDDDDIPYTSRRSNSSEIYGRERNRACWARSVQVTDFVLVNGSTTNIGAFIVWNIKVETLNGSRMNIRKRYSEFDDLRKRLVLTFPNFEAAVPALPPKSVLKRFQPRFLEKRRAGLQYFLNCILLNPEFSGSPVLKEFLFS
ncbi:Phox homologous domain-containing protein [Achaetomium macrosporum]|uniref:Endosomal/vacuolar adapter protein YPT35 n=1 Tax=Achaetomium macrosporum TaxID=79813 RepID=A0AAN7HDF7_9PEZI|nr:Phox homologous domain-containing protein [Achaetomium macrosporum]